MATTAVQLIPLSAEPYRNGSASFPLSEVAADVDVITLWPEYFGIPFPEFSAGSNIDPAHPWTVRMNQLVAEVAATGKPVMLELGFVRTGMVALAQDNNGSLQLIEGWGGVCYDFTSAAAEAIGDGFVNYATWMAQTFQPEYMVNFIEANLYYHDCGGDTASWQALVDIQQRAYTAIKAVNSSIIVFPSIKLESLYGQQMDGWNETEYQAITALSRDRFGMSSYPFGVMLPEGRLATPYDLPMDYLVRTKLRHPEEELAIAETGWNNVSINIGTDQQCIQGLPYSEENFVVDYLGFVLASAHYFNFEIVNWWSMRDSIQHNVLSTCYVRDSAPYAACADDAWCMVINYVKDVTFEGHSELFSELVQKAFGSMGLKTYGGTERGPLMQRWRQELAQPLQE